MTTPITKTTATTHATDTATATASTGPRPVWTALADTAFAHLYATPAKGSGLGAQLAAMRQDLSDGATHGERLRRRALAEWDDPEEEEAMDDISDLVAEAGFEDNTDQPSGIPAAEVVTAADIAQALIDGDDAWAMDSGTADYRPPLAVDPWDVALLARLAKTYGTQGAVNAVLSEGAATVLLCASEAEAQRAAQVLKHALRFRGDAAATPSAPQVVVVTDGFSDTARSRAQTEARLTNPAPLLIVSTLRPASMTGALKHLPNVTLAPHCAETLLWTLRRTHSATGQIAETAVREALPEGAAFGRVTQQLVDLALRATGPLRVARKLAELTVADSDGPTLVDLPGLGAAGAQLAQIAEDVAAYRAGDLPWADVTNGMVLSGTPGTGKTMIAMALARTLNVPFFPVTLGGWQTKGTGGSNVIGALKETFALARAASESLAGGAAIVFIDEIDSLPSRDETHDHNSSYYANVLNALLADLDGAVARAGVIVIGATNRADKLDPALVRPGRLGLHIPITAPAAQTLPGVLRFHLGDDLASVDLGRIARAAAGLSMAETWALVQQARQMARSEKRDMGEDDLFVVLSRTHLPLSKTLRLRAAICAAGHAVAAHVTGSARPDAIRLAGVTGGVDLTRRLDARTRADIGRELVTLLASRAAEEVLIGAPSGRCGGDASSDLARATQLAIREVLSYGHGSLVWCSSEGDPGIHFARHPGLRDRVASRLDGAYARACDLVRDNGDAVEAIAAHLMVDGVVEDDTLRDLLVYCRSAHGTAPDAEDEPDGGLWPGM